ncbi:MAG: hypothetical protein ACYC2G_16430 [Gemmatimonadaceae bacterium]
MVGGPLLGVGRPGDMGGHERIYLSGFAPRHRLGALRRARSAPNMVGSRASRRWG